MGFKAIQALLQPTHMVGELRVNIAFRLHDVDLLIDQCEETLTCI